MNEADVDDDKIVKYKDKEGESQEMTAGAAKKQPDDHPAKVAYNKMADKGGAKSISNVRRVQPGKAKQVDKKLENVNEGKYHDYRNDESLTPKQKIGRSMREIRDSLNELNKLVKMNVRLKNELNVDSRSYWKNTHKALNKISERLVKLANKVGQLQ